MAPWISYPLSSWLIVRAEGYATHVRSIEVPSGARFDARTVTLWPPVTIEGSVVDGAGEPLVADLRWGRIDPGTDEVTWARQQSAESTADGAFAITSPAPGHYVVQVTGRPTRLGDDGLISCDPAPVDCTSGAPLSITLRALDTIKPEMVTGMGPEPWPRATLWKGNGHPVVSAVLGRWRASATINAVPGSYTLVVVEEGEELLRRTVVLEGPVTLGSEVEPLVESGRR